MKTPVNHPLRLVIRNLIKEQYDFFKPASPEVWIKRIFQEYTHGEWNFDNYPDFQEFVYEEFPQLADDLDYATRKQVLSTAWDQAMNWSSAPGHDYEPDYIETGMREQESHLSELAKEMMEFYEKHSEDIDSVEELQDLFERDTIWAREEEPEQLHDAAQEVWQFITGSESVKPTVPDHTPYNPLRIKPTR